MPNWTDCMIYAEGEPDAIQQFLDGVAGEEQPLDFERITPMPDILRRTISGHCKIDGVSVDVWFDDEIDGKRVSRLPTAEEQAELDRIGYASWYPWAIDNWGCKWSASDVDVTHGDGWRYAEITFRTPWSEPAPIFANLRELYPLVEFTFKWRYEDEDVYPHSGN